MIHIIRFNNHRPISLLPVMSKVFEKIKQIHIFLHIIYCRSDCQYGFRPKHSTEHAGLHLYNNTLHQLDLAEIPYAIFIWLLILLIILISKLHYYDMRGYSLNLIENYVRNRKVCYFWRCWIRYILILEFHGTQYWDRCYS